jgi:FkbM family methyltransferase
LNALYKRLTISQRRFFHCQFAKIFRDEHQRLDPGLWFVNFAGRQIRLPLSPARSWLDWDTAVSIIGNDLEIKETYASFIHSSEPPELFVDVGANYGTHSLLFLIHGIDTITFEPNSSCHEYFRHVCELNGVEPRLEPVALGQSKGYVDLWYPEGETWSGSTRDRVRDRLTTEHQLLRQKVEQKTLDHYFDVFAQRRILVKIDMKGVNTKC